ncbi:hypothetical protein [uncultured Jatrophihabitans sp.]|uniref:hypothetical protein n=1 Tax=uncultured Jatrophihabitans sp. TaxID=1610747 RepID=UPI0035C9734A
MSKWPLVALGEVTSQSRDYVRVDRDTTYPLLGVRWYAQGAFHRETVTPKAGTICRVRPGQFIYNRLFAWKGSFGLVTEELAGSYVSNEFPLFDCDPARLMPEYLAFVFGRPEVWSWIERVSTGTTASRNRWNEPAFNSYRVALPSLIEQRRIVSVLSAVDSQIVALETEQRTADEALDRLRNELPTLAPVPLGDVLLAIDSGKSVQTSGEAPRVGKPRILKISALRPGLFRADEAKALDVEMPHSSLVNEGDLLMTRSNTPDRVGYCARARGVPASTYMPDLVWRLRIDSDRVDADFLEQALASPVMRGRVTATATGTSASMRKINKRGISTVMLPLPPIEVQREFAASCLSAVHAVDALAAELAALRVVRADLLSALLSQEITVDAAVDKFVKAA